MRKFLLVNLNNTSTKLGLADEKELLAKKVIVTNNLSIPAVKRAIRQWEFDHALVGSVEGAIGDRSITSAGQSRALGRSRALAPANGER